MLLIVKNNTPATRADTLKIPRQIGEPGNPMNNSWRKGMVVLNDAPSSVLIGAQYLRRDWGEVGQVFRIQRERTSGGKISVEVIYGWTSLSPKRCSPKLLLHFNRGHWSVENRGHWSMENRGHWSVENRLHWRRDAILGEDRCRVRFPPVAHMLAVLNSLVLSLMDLHHVSQVSRQIRRFASHPDEALAWVNNF